MSIFDDTREDWNARPPLRPRTSVPWADRIGVSWHWIGPGRGPSASGSHAKCLDQVREWQRQHQAKDWKDIGYNALVCQHARAIEGRGLTFSGSHSPGVNHSHIGIQFMAGEDTPGGVTPAMFARAVRLRADIGALGKNIRRDWRHLDDPEASTECCGPQIGAWVKAGGPTKTTTITPEDIDMDRTELITILNETVLTKPDGAQLRKDMGYLRDQLRDDLSRLSATVDAQAAALGALAGSAGVDPAAIAGIVDKAVRDRLAQFVLTDTGAQS